MQIETFEIKGYKVEYIDEIHTYLCNGEILPSVTTILKTKFGNMYDFVSPEVLAKASERGTNIHKAIEEYCQLNIDNGLIEVRNFKFLQKQYKFEVVENEIPIILFQDDKPIACGRLDLVLMDGTQYGIADIKTTAKLDKNYLAYQLNMYRIAYQQCYGKEIVFLKGVHLRDKTRKYVSIPIAENIVWELIEEYEGANIE